MPKKDLSDRFAAHSNRKHARRKQAAAPQRPAAPPVVPKPSDSARASAPSAEQPTQPARAASTRAIPARLRKAAPTTFDYSYVGRDLKKIVVTVAVMILIMLALSFVIR